MDEEIMTALKRGDCEIIPASRPEADVRCQLNEISSKAGRTTKFGECPRATKIQTTVPFGKQKLNVWPRDKNGQLID